MELRLEREPSVAGTTLGKLFVNGVFECFTLEDQVRELRHDDGALVDPASWKIPGETAIPSGTYAIIIDWSMRFKKLMPHLIGVPGFSGVRIHSGNTAEDTEGCILVGRKKSIGHELAVGVAEILESHLAFDALDAKLQAAFDRKEQVKITIENAPVVPSAA